MIGVNLSEAHEGIKPGDVVYDACLYFEPGIRKHLVMGKSKMGRLKLENGRWRNRQYYPTFEAAHAAIDEHIREKIRQSEVQLRHYRRLADRSRVFKETGDTAWWRVE